MGIVYVPDPNDPRLRRIKASLPPPAQTPAPTPMPTPAPPPPPIGAPPVVQLIQDIEAKLAQASTDLSQTPPDATDALNLLRAAQTELAQAITAVQQLVPPPTPAPPPPPPGPTASLLGLIAYAGSLKNHTHLADGTYAVVVGDWADAPRLAAVSGKGYAYTISTHLATPTGYVILDPLNNSPWPNALSPDQYIAKCAALKAANPGLHGIFLDNNEALGVTWNPPVPETELVAILAHVSAGLAAHGLRWLSNTGSYIAGNHGSDDGSLWRQWAQAIAPSFEYLLFENWQEASSHVPPVRRVRGTDAWYKHWDDFQKCVAAVPGKFMGATYEYGGDLMFGTYGRASMLTAAGNDPRNVFYASVGNKADPYGQPWQKQSPAPTVDPVRGTATL